MFSAVGFANAAVDFGILNLMLFLFPAEESLTLTLYNLIALVAANLNSYLGNTFLTFRGKVNRDRYETILFVFQAALNVAVNTALFWLCVHLLLDLTGLPAALSVNIAKVFSVVSASLMSFFMMRHLIFGGK